MLDACFPEPLMSVFVGSLLGDGGLQRSKSKISKASFAETHAVDQTEYVVWKHRIWSPFAGSLQRSQRRKPSHQDAIGFQVRERECLAPWQKAFYGHGVPSCDGKIHKKFHPDAVPHVTPLALAIWYMDDGCAAHWPTLSCHERSHPVALAILAKFGFLGTLVVGQSACVQIKGDLQARAFLNLVRPHLLPCFRYKLASTFLATDSETAELVIDDAAVRLLVSSEVSEQDIADHFKVTQAFVRTRLVGLGLRKPSQPNTGNYKNAPLHHLVTTVRTGKRPLLVLPDEQLTALVSSGVRMADLTLAFGVSAEVVRREMKRLDLQLQLPAKTVKVKVPKQRQLAWPQLTTDGIQALLDARLNLKEIARQLRVPYATLQDRIRRFGLTMPKPVAMEPVTTTRKPGPGRPHIVVPVARIKALMAEGVDIKQMTVLFGVSRSTIDRCLKQCGIVWPRRGGSAKSRRQAIIQAVSQSS